jgi:CHAD domain-containing protein
LLTKAIFEKKIEDDSARVKRRSSAYVRSLSPESVHDTRTALRRLESRAEIIPKHSRKRNAKYLKLCRKLLKATTKIRDLDIILLKLSNYPELEGNELIAEIKDKRKSKAESSLKLARKLTNYAVKFDSKQLTERKLYQRFEKLSNRLNRKIESLLPVIVNHPNRDKELHSVRKACKELRYILEVSQEEKRTETLRKWQNYLGNIHDSDVVIAWLSKQKQSDLLANIMRDLKTTRSKQFIEFANLFRQESDQPQWPISEIKVQ